MGKKSKDITWEQIGEWKSGEDIRELIKEITDQVEWGDVMVFTGEPVDYCKCPHCEKRWAKAHIEMGCITSMQAIRFSGFCENCKKGGEYEITQGKPQQYQGARGKGNRSVR